MTTESSIFTEDYYLRFSGIARLYGQKNLEHLLQAHFVVVGLGGVGTWVAEALVRTGIGQISLMDMDEVCVTNTNRQLHALVDNIGHSKAQVLADRLLAINPELKVNIIEDFLSPDNLAEYILPEHDFIIDAIDAAHVKSALIAYCRARKIAMLTVGSAGGKKDARQVTSGDLGNTVCDPLLAKVRQQLYRWHNFQKQSKRKFGIEAIYSTEQAVYPMPNGDVCQQKSMMQDGVRLDCAAGFGSATMLTGTMGFVAAQRAIDKYLLRCNT